MSVIMSDWANPPGQLAARESAENNFLWYRGSSAIFQGGILIDGASRDGGNTGKTTELRVGLLMGKVTSTGKYKQYNPNATDGTEIVAGVLAFQVKVVNLDAADTDKVSVLCVGGCVKNASLYSGASPYTLDQQARNQMFGRFLFDDDYAGNSAGWRNVVAKTADYTVLAADNNKIFTNQGAVGAVVFTLPAIAKGLRYRFFVEADQSVTVTAGTADTLVVFNDAAADSIAFSTTAEKVGGAIEVFANADATKWLVHVMLGAETQTPTIAT